MSKRKKDPVIEEWVACMRRECPLLDLNTIIKNAMSHEQVKQIVQKHCPECVKGDKRLKCTYVNALSNNINNLNKDILKNKVFMKLDLPSLMSMCRTRKEYNSIFNRPFLIEYFLTNPNQIAYALKRAKQIEYTEMVELLLGFVEPDLIKKLDAGDQNELLTELFQQDSEQMFRVYTAMLENIHVFKNENLKLRLLEEIDYYIELEPKWFKKAFFHKDFMPDEGNCPHSEKVCNEIMKQLMVYKIRDEENEVESDASKIIGEIMEGHLHCFGWHMQMRLLELQLPNKQQVMTEICQNNLVIKNIDQSSIIDIVGLPTDNFINKENSRRTLLQIVQDEREDDEKITQILREMESEENF
jgi:hypothetical protein